MTTELDGVIEALMEMVDDTTVPQNVRTKLNKIILSLQDEHEEVTLKVNKILDNLEDISNDSNLPSYTRTQIWNISCMLETM